MHEKRATAQIAHEETALPCSMFLCYYITKSQLNLPILNTAEFTKRRSEERCRHGVGDSDN
jgi:hypothetical protein